MNSKRWSENKKERKWIVDGPRRMRMKHSFLPLPPIIRQIPFSTSRSFRIARARTLRRLFAYTERYTHGQKGGRGKGYAFERDRIREFPSGRFNFSFTSKEKRKSPSRCLPRARRAQCFPARFLGNRAFGTFFIDGLVRRKCGLLFYGGRNRNVETSVGNPWIGEEKSLLLCFSWFLSLVSFKVS